MLQIPVSNWNKNLENVFLFIKNDFPFLCILQLTLQRVIKIITFKVTLVGKQENYRKADLFKAHYCVCKLKGKNPVLDIEYLLSKSIVCFFTRNTNKKVFLKELTRLVFCVIFLF